MTRISDRIEEFAVAENAAAVLRRASILSADAKRRFPAALGVCEVFEVIPRLGAIGAAGVTLTFAVVGAAAAVAFVWRLCAIAPPLASLLRASVVAALAYAAAAAWPAPGVWIVAKLAALGLASLAALWLLGELADDEAAWVRARLRSVS